MKSVGYYAQDRSFLLEYVQYLFKTYNKKNDRLKSDASTN